MTVFILLYYVFIVDDSIFLEYMKNTSPYIFLLDRFFFELSKGSFKIIVTDHTLLSVEKKAREMLKENQISSNEEHIEKYVDWIKNLENVDINHVTNDILEEASSISNGFSIDLEDAVNVVVADKLDAMVLFLKPNKDLRILKSMYDGRVTFLSNVYFAGGSTNQVAFWWD